MALFNCSKCNKSCRTRKGIIQHLKKNVCVGVRNDTDTSTKIHKCSYCSRQFQSVGGLSYHAQKSHGVTSSQECQQCKKKFRSHAVLTCHLINEHNDSTESSNNVVKCVYCMLVFSSRKDRLHHVQKEHGDEHKAKMSAKQSELLTKAKFDCTFCQKSFTRKSNVRQHEEVCTGKNQYLQAKSTSTQVLMSVFKEECENYQSYSPKNETLQPETEKKLDTSLPCSSNSLNNSDLFPEMNHSTESSTFLDVDASPSLKQYLRDRKGFMSLDSEDVATPQRSKLNLKLGQEIVRKYQKKVTSLQQTIRRLRNKISTMEQTIDHLQNEGHIPSDFADSLMVCFPEKMRVKFL